MILQHLSFSRKVLSNQMFRWELFALRINGCVFCEEDRFKYLHLIRGLCNVAIFIVAMCFDVAFLVKIKSDTQTATIVAAAFIAYLNISVKIMAFYYYHEGTHNLLTEACNWTDNLILNAKPAIKTLFEFFLKKSKRGSVIIGILLLLCGSVDIMGVIYFLSTHFNDIRQGTLNPNLTLPELYYMQPNWAFTNNFFLAHMYPLYVEIFGCVGLYCWASVYTSLMKFPAFRLDCISYKLEHLTDYFAQADIDSRLTEAQKGKDSKRLLVECTIEFVQVQLFIKKFQETTRIALFTESTTTAILLCFIAYNMQQRLTFQDTVVIVLWVFATLAILFVYYWNANEISIKSNRIGTSLYMSDWYKLPTPVQKDVLLFMTGTVKPIIITAVLFTMNMQNFGSILKTSYSYFTLLKTMANSEDEF